MTATFLPWNKKIEIAEGSTCCRPRPAYALKATVRQGKLRQVQSQADRYDNAAPTTAETGFGLMSWLQEVLAARGRSSGTPWWNRNPQSADERKTARAHRSPRLSLGVKKQFLQLSRPTVGSRPGPERLAALPGAHLAIEL